MHSRLFFQEPVGVLALHEKRDIFQPLASRPLEFTPIFMNRFRAKALFEGILLIHPPENRDPVFRVLSPSSCVDVENRVPLIIRPFEQFEKLKMLKFHQKLCCPFFNIWKNLFRAPTHGKKLSEASDLIQKILNSRNFFFYLARALGNGSRPLLVLPEIRLLHLIPQADCLFFLAEYVKVGPRARGPGSPMILSFFSALPLIPSYQF